MNIIKDKIVQILKTYKVRQNMGVFFIVITYAFLALISVGAIFYGLYYKGKVVGIIKSYNREVRYLNKLIEDRDQIICDKTNKIEILFENIEELSEYKLRCLDLEDDINRIDSTNMRLNVSRIDCPLNENELILFSKMISKAFKEGDTRNNLKALMDTQDKIVEIVDNHTSFKKYEKSLDKIKKDDKRKVPVSKNKIGRSG